MKLTETKTAFKVVSISHSSTPQSGDEFIFHAKLTNHDGVKVGSLDVVCTVTLGGTIQCPGTFTLPGGTIASTAPVSATKQPSVVHIAITGGTARYDRVLGQVSSTTQAGQLLPTSSTSTNPSDEQRGALPDG